MPAQQSICGGSNLTCVTMLSQKSRLCSGLVPLSLQPAQEPAAIASSRTRTTTTATYTLSAMAVWWDAGMHGKGYCEKNMLSMIVLSHNVPNICLASTHAACVF